MKSVPTLIFDGDCSFCTSSVNWLQKNLPGKFAVQPYQKLELDTLGLTTNDAQQQIWLIEPQRQSGGHRALTRLFQKQPRFGWRMLGFLLALPVVNALFFFVYSLVAKNRHLLPGGTPACKL